LAINIKTISCSQFWTELMSGKWYIDNVIGIGKNPTIYDYIL